MDIVSRQKQTLETITATDVVLYSEAATWNVMPFLINLFFQWIINAAEEFGVLNDSVVFKGNGREIKYKLKYNFEMTVNGNKYSFYHIMVHLLIELIAI